MAETKTKPTEITAESFIDTVDHPGKREDAKVLDALFRKVTGEEPRMWGPTIVGYGQYHYRYDSGREGDSCLTGFSSRKNDISIYLMTASARQDMLLAQLGRHKMGKACLSVRSLADVDMRVLRELVSESVAATRAAYPRA